MEVSRQEDRLSQGAPTVVHRADSQPPWKTASPLLALHSGGLTCGRTNINQTGPFAETWRNDVI
jgi:hypothetical protein